MKRARYEAKGGCDKFLHTHFAIAVMEHLWLETRASTKESMQNEEFNAYPMPVIRKAWFQARNGGRNWRGWQRRAEVLRCQNKAQISRVLTLLLSSLLPGKLMCHLSAAGLKVAWGLRSTEWGAADTKALMGTGPLSHQFLLRIDACHILALCWTAKNWLWHISPSKGPSGTPKSSH